MLDYENRYCILEDYEDNISDKRVRIPNHNSKYGNVGTVALIINMKNDFGIDITGRLICNPQASLQYRPKAISFDGRRHYYVNKKKYIYMNDKQVDDMNTFIMKGGCSNEL